MLPPVDAHPTPDPAAPLIARLQAAARPAQTLDELETSAAVVALLRRTLASEESAGRPPAPAMHWLLGEAATSVVEQLCVKAELPPGRRRDRMLSAMNTTAAMQGTTPVMLLITLAQQREARDVGLF